ncbi:hypothetical protein ACMDB5_07515 [Flavobacterium sp. W1B]|uniref:hypothetical protein n=1 Tax=Flavobacterium sp. W1B TaxID=3394146 RepID=UPI0039BD056F
MKKLSIVILTSIILTSCSQNLFNFTLVSTKNIELEKLSSLEKASERTKGEDKTSIIIFIPTRKIKIDQAINNTIDGIPGCVALLDGVVYSKFWWIPYIYGQQRIVIEATPLVDPSIAKSSKTLPKYGKIFLDKKGEIKSIESISEVEFSFEKNKL